MVLKNELPESTSLHLHGIRVPNAMDGVDPYTQKPITPGSEFTYEFTALEPSVGMYHSHHDAQVQVPNGLAGALIIGDWKTLAMNAARGRVKDTDGIAEQENMMVLNDSGTIGLSLNGKSFPATTPFALKVGESMVVHYFNEGNMTHPMHLHQPSGLVVAHDGKVLESPFWAYQGERDPRFLAFAIPGVIGEEIVRTMEKNGFLLDAGSACGAGALSPSHVLDALGWQNMAHLRITLKNHHTPADVNRLVSTLATTLKNARA